jgi:hypothetical protein
METTDTCTYLSEGVGLISNAYDSTDTTFNCRVNQLQINCIIHQPGVDGVYGVGGIGRGGGGNGWTSS